MRRYLLPLAFAVSTACAEEPAEPKCIDHLTLSVDIKPSVVDSANSESVDKALSGVKDFYRREVDLDVVWEYSSNRIPGDIHVIFGTVDDCLEEWFPNAEAIVNYGIRNAQDGGRRQELELVLEQMKIFSPHDKIRTDQVERQKVLNTLFEAGAVSEPSTRQVYVFPEQFYLDLSIRWWEREMNPVEGSWANTTAHELGHNLGLEHSQIKNGSDTRHNIMYVSMVKYSIDQYSFSETDKATILKQICKPEEQK